MLRNVKDTCRSTTTLGRQEQAMYEHNGRPGYWTARDIRDEQLVASSAKEN
jgi:hypothetical protein